ncbi:MAG: sugar kinase [Opitutae bacterium]|nr:sugar kinase [Opitutae bacterium]
MKKLNLSSIEPKPVLIVGSVAFDNIITPHATGERILGGSASYAALATSYYAPARLVGVVGHDFDEKHIHRFRAHDIDIEGLQRDESGPTFFWKGKYHENFNKRDTIDIQLNVFENFRPELPNNYRDSEYLMLGNIAPGLQLHVLEQIANTKPYVLADTIDLWIDIQKDELLQVVSKVNLFVINDSESEQLTGENNIILAGKKLLELGTEAAIIKKGEHGAYLFHPDGLFALPAYPVTELRDPTGAGDSFSGGLLGYLAAHDDTSFKTICKAMVYATATASMTVEDFSCDRLESAGADAIQARSDELLAMTQL